MRAGLDPGLADQLVAADERRRDRLLRGSDQLARDLEAAGYAHLMAYDHMLGASAERLATGEFGGFGTPPYTDQHTFQEILTLFAHLSAVTTTLGFVTSVVVLPQRQTAAVAKQVATIDLLSGGRLRLAVGVGWNWAEYEALGADFVPLYRTRLLAPEPPEGDVVVLASGSAARAYAGIGGTAPAVSIGPQTTRVAREVGLTVAREASTHDLDGLVAAVVSLR